MDKISILYLLTTEFLKKIFIDETTCIVSYLGPVDNFIKLHFGFQMYMLTTSFYILNKVQIAKTTTSEQLDLEFTRNYL